MSKICDALILTDTKFIRIHVEIDVKRMSHMSVEIAFTGQFVFSDIAIMVTYVVYSLRKLTQNYLSFMSKYIQREI